MKNVPRLLALLALMLASAWSVAPLSAQTVGNDAMNSNPNLRGVQLYTLRAAMDRDLAGTLRAVAAAGYRQVEFAGFFGHEPAEIRALLNESGLSAPASHFPLAQMESDFPSVIEEARALGSHYVVLAWLDPGRRSAADYRALVNNLNAWGRQCRDAGLRLAYHNHDFEFEQTEGFIPYQLLLDGTDPELVAFEMDLYWMHKAGQDPLAYFARYPGRFPLWHLKDASEEGAMADVGQGVIDFPALLAQAELAGLEYGFVERDDAEDPLESIRTSVNAVKTWAGFSR